MNDKSSKLYLTSVSRPTAQTFLIGVHREPTQQECAALTDALYAHFSDETPAVDVRQMNRDQCAKDGHVLGVPCRVCMRCHDQFAAETTAERWIPVAERMPPPHRHVWCLNRSGRQFEGAPCYGMHAPFFTIPHGDGSPSNTAPAWIDVTHWRNLPASPEKATAECAGCKAGWHRQGDWHWDSIGHMHECTAPKTTANVCDIRCFDYPKCECGRGCP